MFGAIVPLVTMILDKVIPDKTVADASKVKLIELAQTGELAAMNAVLQRDLAQMEVNKAEAATDLFRGGWRPFVGWVCGSGLAMQFVIGPILTWATTLAGRSIQFPVLDLSVLLTLLFGMLGLGAMRTTEKLKGK